MQIALNTPSTIGSGYASGAGAIGDYEDCTFSTSGQGRFRPMPGADPATGRVGISGEGQARMS